MNNFNYGQTCLFDKIIPKNDKTCKNIKITIQLNFSALIVYNRIRIFFFKKTTPIVNIIGNGVIIKACAVTIIH